MQPAPGLSTGAALEANPPGDRARSLGERLGLSLAALGVVYGDIGTSPLYAIRECFKTGSYGVTPTPGHVLSVLSLVFWVLTLVVAVKYLAVVLRADNHGEGGILALLALLLERERDDTRPTPGKTSRGRVVAVLGVFGTALLLADGMITPSISVLSAVEGIEVAAPHMDDLVVPLTAAVLVALFLAQRLGTARIAGLFGPVMLVWFTVIALMGLPWIVRQPRVLAAVDPRHGLGLFVSEPGVAFFLLGAIVLCVTGAEALYADMGHFGKGPIRRAWYAVVFPALLLNYLGQGAFILSRDGHIVATAPDGSAETMHIFYSMVSPVLLYPILALATLATVIASQALISGAYSLAQQAVELGYLPRLTIVHTSDRVIGQIYVPFISWALMGACLFLVIQMRASSRLADAYGIAVMGTMLITSLLLFRVMRVCWGWSLPAAGALLGLFLAVELPLLASNLSKVVTGGWIPLLAGAVLFIVMTTWRRGRKLLSDPATSELFHFPLRHFVGEIEQTRPHRNGETWVFLTAAADMVPKALLEMAQRTGFLPGRLVLFTVKSEPVPHVGEEDAVEIREYGQGCYGVTARQGFMQSADVGRYLAICTRKGLPLDPEQVYFYLSRITIVTTGRARMAPWRKRLFALMYRNARPATSYYSLPPGRVVELGRLVEI